MTAGLIVALMIIPIITSITREVFLTVPRNDKDGALAWLEGKLIETFDFGGDHELFIAQITAGAILHPGASFTHQRGSGFHY